VGCAIAGLAPWTGAALQQKEASGPVEAFETSRIFWQQSEAAKKVVAARDPSVLPRLERWLRVEDRHARANAAFIFASFGDERGHRVLEAILNDRSDRGVGQGIPGGNWTQRRQIEADRYYAVHIMGVLKDPRYVPALESLLEDRDVNYKVPWSLGQIGNKAAIQVLLKALSNRSADVRVYAIQTLEQLNAREALPKLREMLNDGERSHLDRLLTVAEAARSAIETMESQSPSGKSPR
jgi:HEAT repeat protein